MQAFLILILLVLLAGCGAMPRVAGAGMAAAPGTAAAPGEAVLHADAEIFSAVHRQASGAQRRVLVEMYEFGRADLRAALLDASRRGLDVRLVYDPSVAVTARTAAWLSVRGVSVRPYPLDDRRHQIDHVKLLLVDSAGLVGGMNWGSTSVRNHDYALETRAPADLARLAAIFEQDWSLAGGRPAPLGPAAVAERVLETAPGADVRGRLLKLLATAQRQVEAEIFVLTDPDVEAALAAARRRGVDVRVLLDPHQDTNPAALAMLRGAGVGARLYPVAAGGKLHAKVLRADSHLLLGSANWTLSGLGVNHELDLEIGDAGPVTSFAKRFETDWASAA